MANILILDDNFELASEWRAEFRKRGHEVELALTSSEAIALADAYEYDLFIVDLLIRVEGAGIADSGRRLLSHLKQRFGQSRRDLPVIGVSGFQPIGTGTTVRSVYNVYGVTVVLLKPFTVEDLADTAEDYISRLQAAGDA